MRLSNKFLRRRREEVSDGLIKFGDEGFLSVRSGNESATLSKKLQDYATVSAWGRFLILIKQLKIFRSFRNSMNHHPNFVLDDEGKLSFADTENDFEFVNYSTLDENYKNCTQASHCMLYSKSNATVLDIYQPRALILMQFRFDGYIGFPGGIVDPGESPEDALNRELSEELGVTSLIEFKKDERMVIHYNKYKSLLLHFFVKEVCPDVFREIELRSIKAPEYGNEVLGTLRVPLYTMTDGYRGFPAFLQNKFIGNSRKQLLECLKILKLMSAEEIQKALTALPLHLKNNKFSEKD